MTNLQAALKTLAEHSPQATVKTSDDPEVRERIESFSAARTTDDQPSISRKQTRNFMALSNLMGAVEVRGLLAANSAKTMEQKNAVLSAELRRRGLTPFGESKAIINLAVSHGHLSSTPAAAEPMKPLQATAAIYAALTPDEQKLFDAAGGKITDAPAQAALTGGAILRSQFESMNPQAKMDFFKAGGKLADDPQPKPASRPAFAQDSKTKTRAEFEGMTHGDRNVFFRNGGKLID